MKKTLSLLALLLAGIATAQNQRHDIESKLKSYFQASRETIHLHLNKTIFLVDEAIWFKGYIIEKQSELPFARTSNVYVQLLDDQGQILDNKLYYAEGSIFEGKFNLNQTLPSGLYYLQVYTNYMNNFIEDESTVYRITLANPRDGRYPDVTKPAYETMQMHLFPESGVFLSRADNTFGVWLADCHGNGAEISDAKLLDVSGNLIKQFSTDKFGYGRFDLTENGAGPYKIQYSINGRTMETALPMPSVTGLTFSTNNFTQAGKVFFKIKTNAATIKDIADRPYTLVIQKSGAVSTVDFAMKPGQTEQTLAVSADHFANGINSIWLIDAQKKRLAHRLVYNPTTQDNRVTANILSKHRDSIRFSAKSKLPLGEVSISVLPRKTLSNDAEFSLSGTFEFDQYMKTPLTHADYYLNGFSRAKHYALDNALLCHESKYDWEVMMTREPDTQYEFDQGLAVKGKLNSVPGNTKGLQLRLSSLAYGLSETLPIDATGEFELKNLIISDSGQVHFSLLDKGKIIPTKAYTRVTNNNRKFIKKFFPDIKKCRPDQYLTFDQELPLPKIKEAIEIQEVAVMEKGPKLKDRSKTSPYTRMGSNGYKITDAEVKMYRDVLAFIQAHGFNVETVGTQVIIRSRNALSFRGTASPIVYLDDMPLQDFGQLYQMTMDRVDEIYINKRGYGGGDGAVNGIIRIYSKPGYSIGSKPVRIDSSSLIVKGGFERTSAYKGLDYADYQNDGFNSMGVVDWIPSAETDQNGDFNFTVPNYSQNSVLIKIEGIATDGRIISQTQEIEIQ